MTLVGRAVLVRFVLTAIPIYLLVAIKVSKWFLRSMDKIRRGFLFFFLEYAGELHLTGFKKHHSKCVLPASLPLLHLKPAAI